MNLSDFDFESLPIFVNSIGEKYRKVVSRLTMAVTVSSVGWSVVCQGKPVNVRVEYEDISSALSEHGGQSTRQSGIKIKGLRDELGREIQLHGGNEGSYDAGKLLTKPSGDLVANEASHCELEAKYTSECPSDRQSNNSDTTISQSDGSSSGGSVYQNVCNGDEDQETRALSILDPIRRRLVDKVMGKFWVIFGQTMLTDPDSCEGNGSLADGDYVSNNGDCAGTIPSSSAASSDGQFTPTVQHKRRLSDEQEDGDDDDRRKKAPSKRLPLPSASVKGIRFACPFRKHDPRIYTLHSHRICASSCWTTIARIKYVSYLLPKFANAYRIKTLGSIFIDVTVKALTVKDAGSFLKISNSWTYI
jgi:hypothetical protein